MQWNEYVGGALPKETTHVQLSDGSVVEAAHVIAGEGGILRYYGPTLVVGTPQVVDEPILPIPREAWADVVDACAEALICGQLVTITHPEGYARCGMGLPFRKGEGLTHEYRPIILLDWINSQVVKAY